MRTLDGVTRELIGEHLMAEKRRGLAGSSLSRFLAALKVFFRFLASNRYVRADITDVLESPKIWKHLPEVLSVEETERLLAAPRPGTHEGRRDRAILELMYATGLRVSEVAGLKTEEVNLEVGYLRCLGKGSKERIVPLGRQARKAVKSYLAETRPAFARPASPGVLFLTRRGRGFTRQGSGGSSRSTPAWRGSGRGSRRTRSGTRSPRTSSRTAPISGSCRRCSGTPTSPRRRPTRTSTQTASRGSTQNSIHAPGSGR